MQSDSEKKTDIDEKPSESSEAPTEKPADDDKDDDFSIVIVMANSFGYFPDEEENQQVLKEIYRILKTDGKLLLDLTDANHVKNNLTPISWHEANRDIIVCRQREFDGELIKVREIVISKKKGLIRDGHYCGRIYEKEKIKQSLENSGFKNISVQNNLSLHNQIGDYGFLTSRMLVTAQKLH